VTTEGTYTFSVQVTDSAGATDVETFTITVVAPRPLTVATTTLPPGVARFRRHLDASGRKPGKERFRCPELGRLIPRSFVVRRSV
jgi:hypothetical protein